MSDQNGLLNEITEPTELNDLETLRHSTAHVMAHAISRLWPEAKFGIGPTVEDGFYYDVDLPVKLTRMISRRLKKR
jgi:threonyl-tRNA synthetase